MNDEARTRVEVDGGAHAPTAPADGRVATGGFVALDGEDFYRIAAVDRMPPFLMNLPTDTDLWMFVSSTGGLTAGRVSPDGAFFPYETVDRLHDAPHHTGPITLVRAARGGRPPRLWEPLAPLDGHRRGVRRALAKNVTGTRLVFEEASRRENLAFRARWCGSDETGWVRTATLANLGREPVAITLLDGFRNVLPCGAPLALHQHSSCLVDAYKRVDVDEATRLGIFSLTARILDRPEPAESLRATTVWCHGLPGFDVALSLEAIEAFRRGEPVAPERVLTGRRGNYLVTARLRLAPGARVRWHLAIDTGRGHVEIAALRRRLREEPDLGAWIEGALDRASANLRRIVASADGLEVTGRREQSAHHFANVLYNGLRGGVFVDNHAFPRADFADFVRARHRAVAARQAARLAALPETATVADLARVADASDDPDFRRLCLEYLPLFFGRRHGDPSRPWNRFEISVRREDGSRALHHEGNWRDVFQNWEALARSFPAFLPGVIARFLDGSTVDGFNPYRITRDGVDWEVPDPDHPWSGIGYWGDHQIVYLLRLLEAAHEHAPGWLEGMLGEAIFAYADVPYRLRPHAEMLADPRHTIEYDEARAAAVASRVAEEGHDGKLVHLGDGAIRHATLLEKLLVPALAKLGAFVPDGGIWMNTERPEWNDANNALVGSGVSVVTLCHLRRYLVFLDRLAGESPEREVAVARDVADWLRRVADVLGRHRESLAAPRVGDEERARVLDELGEAFSDYRARAYDPAAALATTPLGATEVRSFCRDALAHVEHAIRASRRDDGLYHAYHVLARDGARVTLQPLAVMLEGQVAALSSGLVDAREAAAMIARLYESALYRPDQDSFLLYPEKTLPAFLDRNRVPEARAMALPLVRELLAAGDRSVIERDADGVLRFQADFVNARDLDAALDRIAAEPRRAATVAQDRAALVALFVDVFGHRTYTGRSGTMYAYEGLGSVYWHMVAKLLLAVQEVTLEAFDAGAPEAVREALVRHYHRIRGGLGFEKSVSRFGAFPADPYSHTPAHAGAQQPGMTGQVKEEILTRLGELGVRVRGGLVEFDPVLLRPDEFLASSERVELVGLEGAPRALEVPAGALAFTFCQVPVVYTLTAGAAWVRVLSSDGRTSERAGHRLDEAASRDVLERRGGIARIEVGVPDRALWRG